MTVKMKVHQKLNRNRRRGSYEMNQMKLLSGLNQMKSKKFRCIKGDSGLNQMKNKKFRCIKGDTDLRRKLFHLGVIMKLKKLLQYKHKKPCQV
ncbi:hypothetical protein ACQJBY_010009 [Aegilops geniculata]